MNRYKGGYQIIKLKNPISYEAGDLSINSNDFDEFQCIIDMLKLGELKPVLLHFVLDDGDSCINICQCNISFIDVDGEVALQFDGSSTSGSYMKFTIKITFDENYKVVDVYGSYE